MPTRRSKGSGGSIEQWVVPAIEITSSDSIRIHMTPVAPLRDLYGHEREIAAMIYKLAAELELRSERLDARWAISPDPFRARLDLELSDGDDAEAALQLVTSVLKELGHAELRSWT